MAYRTPPFRSSFPMLLASSLLLAQPISSFAASQVQCTPSGNSWSCEPIQARGELPPRPVQATPPPPPVSNEPVGIAASAVAANDAGNNDYSRLDWVPREQLSAEQQAAIAPYCGGTYVEPERSGRDDETPFDQLPVYASAESSRFEQGSQTGVLEGDVLMRQGRLQARADQASFDQANSSARLEGNVRLRDQGVLVLGDQASMRIDNGETRIDNVDYVIHDARARGTADKLMRRDDGIIVMTDGSYTTCEPGENTWSLHSKDIELDRDKGWGEAKHVVLKVKDVPVFYTPYIYFPLDDRRQTGLLTPSFSQSTDNGTEIETPYYINIAPDYDATLYPRYMSERGLQMEGEFRYLKPDNEGSLSAAYLNDSKFNENRWLYGWQHEGGMSSRWATEVDFTDISDPFYFQDLNSALDVTSDTYVNQRAAVTYRGDGWRFQAAVHGYELATITSLTPYQRLPQLRLDGADWLGDTGLRFGYNAEYTYFDRDLDSGFITGENGIQFDSAGNAILTPDENLIGLQRATGHRVSVSPSLSYPWRNSFAFVTPSVRVQSTYYDLDFDARSGDGFNYGNANTTPSSTIPITSLDSGLYFDRETSWFGNNLRQTLEPRAFYLYAPDEDQNDQPLFDTNENTFSYNSLFRDDRFSGNDRVGDANQLALGVTSRALEEDGTERARGSLGQVFYFRDRNVQLLEADGTEPDADTSSSSAYAAELMYRVSDAWRLNADMLWDPDNSGSDAGSFMANYQPEPRKILNMGYRYRNNINTFNALTGSFDRDVDRRIDQSDMSFMWPLNPQWSLIGRWQHDFADDRTLEALGGLEYDSCCWKLRVVNRYWVDYNEFESVARDEANRGIFLQIVLKGLGSVTGNDVDSLLGDGIPGYREREKNAL
ncbi:LPS-assembly protein LptD [Pseudomonas neustonica]|uniref:LPS-assembly protein LptD n=1 Tax=Pseudomonas neustonica TaxID=2487346 RepID=A0ABX9XKM8_9PSED|nr:MULTISPECIES: LPS-assembly protein LptD [Pseudomonas]MAB23643.1 LPS biosynthesis protein [Pseudomonadales bacterium]ROZ85726.1 LPS-assembly protein LptD [Pseudomonas sp. SSM44]ROZ87382.1 LPS-assembly protein LptD [Pseudomonas neustonica]